MEHRRNTGDDVHAVGIYACNLPSGLLCTPKIIRVAVRYRAARYMVTIQGYTSCRAAGWYLR